MPTSAPPHATEEPARIATGESRADDGLDGPVADPNHGWRDRLRSKPGLRECYRVAVFIAGLLCVAAGIALAVLPGPLTIPPILLGLWIWSTEFRFAQRFFDAFKEKARNAWAHAKTHPISSGCITGGGLLVAAAAVWTVMHFGFVDAAKDALL